MSETPETLEAPTQPRQTVTIDAVTYFRDSLTPKDEQTLQNILVVQEELATIQRTLNITLIAKESLLNEIASRVSEFEALPVVKAEAE